MNLLELASIILTVNHIAKNKNKKMSKSKLSIIKNHDYISLVMPYGRFTIGRSGAKASGKISSDSFARLDAHVVSLNKAGKNYGEAMNDLLDEKTLTLLCPEWNEAPTYVPVVDDVVIINDAKLAAKHGDGVVVSVTRKRANVMFASCLLSVENFLLKKV